MFDLDELHGYTVLFIDPACIELFRRAANSFELAVVKQATGPEAARHSLCPSHDHHRAPRLQ